MSFVKRYANALTSVVCYALLLIIVYVLPRLIWPGTIFLPAQAQSLFVVIAIALLVLGFFFGFRSIKAKESSWAGNFVVVLGALIVAAPFILSSFAFWGFLYSLGIR